MYINNFFIYCIQLRTVNAYPYLLLKLVTKHSHPCSNLIIVLITTKPLRIIPKTPLAGAVLIYVISLKACTSAVKLTCKKTFKIGITNFGPMNWFINFSIKFIEELILPIQLDKNEKGEKVEIFTSSISNLTNRYIQYPS